MSTEAVPAATEISAKAAKYYRYTRFVMVLILLGYGGWSIFDGFVKYPRENEAAHLKDPLAKLPHEGLDVPFNQWLGIFLPPLSLLFLGWTLYNSRGRYRLTGRTIEAPGHPPVPVEAIRLIDKTRWDKKGIAYIDYQLPADKGTIKLDDFVYEREPTDAILESVEKLMKSAAPAPMSPASPVIPPRPPRQQVR